MPKYKISWNIGYGDCEDVIEADCEEDAVFCAYEAAREDFEAQAHYGAKLIANDEPAE